MKQTKIKQVQGQASLKSFFKPKNADVQDDIQTENKENTIYQQNLKIDIKVEDDGFYQQQIDNNLNSVQNPSFEQNDAQEYENSYDILQKREEYIKKKLSPFKYSKKKSFKSKVKAKIGQDDSCSSPLNKKRMKQSSKWIRMTPSSKKKIKVEEDDTIEQEQKLASIYKQERLSSIQFSPKEDQSKQNQMEVQDDEQVAMVSQFDSRQDAFSNNSKKSECSKGSKSEGKANRQLQINDFRQFNSTLKNNQSKLCQKNLSEADIQNNNKMIVEYEECNRTMECETNINQIIIHNQIEENNEKGFQKNNNQIEQSKQNSINKDNQILTNNSTQQSKESKLNHNIQILINNSIEDNKQISAQNENKNCQIQEEQQPKINQKKKMKNLLSFCVPTQGKNSDKAKQKENIINGDQEKDQFKESRLIQKNKDDQPQDKQVQLKNVLQKQSENKIKSQKESTNSKLVFGKQNINKEAQKQDDIPQESDQQLLEEDIQNLNQQQQENENELKELEENKKNIDAQTKANEKNAQNLFKIFISHMEQNVKDLSDIQQKNLNKIKKLKPVTKNCYENQIKQYQLSEQYDNFIVQYEKIQELKNQFSDYIEFMKIPKKKKNEINKQINQVYKQFPTNREEFEKTMKQNLDMYYSRFLKFTSFPENEQNNKQKREEKQEVQKMEMKGKDNYRVISYKTQWDQQIEIRPTEEQLDVIVSDIKKDTKIIACAGSGKTTTLVIRLKYLLDHGVKPNQIIISTFNIEAGKHISQKVYEMIGKEVQQSILIGNIDKIAYKFIRSELEAKQKNSQSVLLFSQREYCDIWLAHIKKYKFQYLQYKYFFFDEFQDVSELQYEILMEFKKLNCILTVIGDDAQNIYGFRDTKIDIIQNRINDDLKKKKKDLLEFRLTANYRSTHLITKFANKIIEKNENLIKKTMQSAQEIHGETEEEKMKSKYDKEGDYPYLHIFDSEKQQNESIIKRILSLVKNKGFQFKDIAIIGPMNDQLKKFEEVVEKHNQKSIQSDQIPYQAFITLKFEDFKLIEFNAAPQKQNKLTISTIHRSKGLEWDIVYFLGCNDDQFPMAFVQKNKNQACTILEEQRRLFYVGATRAIKELNFCCIVKEPEKMKEKDKMQGKFKVTRFFADIPREYYRADIILDFQDHIIKDYKWIEFDESQNGEEEQNCIKIREVISKMNSKQLEDINTFTQNIVQEKVVKSLYMEKHEISQQVKDNQLFSEMGMFFDRCIVRMIGEKYKAKNSFYNQVAAQVILPQIYELHLPENLFRLFLRYSKFFTTFDSAQLDDQRNVIERFKNEGDRDKSEQDIQDMQELHNILSYNAEIQCLKKIHIFNFQKHRPNKYFQDQFERLGQSYIIALSEYMNKHKKSEDIFENIYKISKCGFLFENRRKYLYNNNLTAILDYELLKNIQINFINGYLSQYQSIECKKIYKTKNIQGLIDLIANQNHLIFFKFDIFETYKKEDFLNYLFAASYMYVTDKINIEQISIFNFLSGTIQSIDLRGWDQQQSFFNQIEQIAKGQILQNVQNNILQIIDQEEDKVLNKEQKEELKKIIFQSKTPQELQENIENIKSGQKSVNKAQMIDEGNKGEEQIEQQRDNKDNQNQLDRGMIVEEDYHLKPQEQKDKSQLIDQNFIEHNRQVIDSYDPLRKKIQFEEQNHPAILFNDIQIDENSNFLNNEFDNIENQKNFSQIINNNKINEDHSKMITEQQQDLQFKQEEEQDKINQIQVTNVQNQNNDIKIQNIQKQQFNQKKTEFKSSIQYQKELRQKELIESDKSEKVLNKIQNLQQTYLNILQDTSSETVREKKCSFLTKENSKNQVQFQPQQIQERKKQFYSSNNNLSKQFNQKSFEQNTLENQIFEESYQAEQDFDYQKQQKSGSIPDLEEDDISNIQSQEEDNNYSQNYNFQNQIKENKIISSNLYKKNVFKGSNKSPNSKLNLKQEIKLKPGNITPTYKVNQKQFEKNSLINYNQKFNSQEEEDIDSDQDDSDVLRIIQRLKIQEQEKKKH
ncbi:UvrD/REP family helicase (macronuclear) [Tetrahymena thermophila SB210]|uniref:DNA 3'-5' helicase n=1 Tax=Tetrahymena thermophila (strain SB210) TaxID=312017 RepID=I7LZL9_TETTS|nr:UvrD/REP family helicase [Tetrahymena thermophila SB210]EAR84176.2 UvrD/REP family helicase [Tetrahymena thermophila SB210]|eukprot:XP_001031839.2 UvrD/REP family helicase [Tetrahymena thermophila SB210]